MELSMKLKNALTLSPVLLVLLLTLIAAPASACTEPECDDHEEPGAELDISPNPADLNEQVRFDATESYDHDGEVVKYKFDFDNDGDYDRYSTDGVVHERFDTPGSKEVKLKVIDDDDKKDTTVKSYEIRNEDPEARIDISPNPAGVQEKVRFDATSSYDEDGEIVRYKFDFDNDGDYDRISTDGVVHERFDTPGSREVKVKVVDNHGDKDTVSKSYEIRNEGPEARLTISPNPAQVDEKVRFDATDSFDEDGEIVRYKFDFDNDGDYDRTSTDGIVHERFSSPRSENVKVKVIDNQGKRDTVVKSYRIENRAPRAKLDISPNPADLNEKIRFDATDSFDEDGEIVRYKFDLDGDGDYDRISTDGVVHEKFDAPGSREAKVKVVDNSGKSSTASKSYRVENKGPKARLAISPSPADLNEKVRFDATGSYDEDGEVVRYKFDFDNDGVYDKSSTDGIVYKRFGTTGSREAKVKVIDNHGGKSTALKSYRIENMAKSCSVVSGFLRIEDDDINEGESTGASINVYNHGKEQKIKVTFKLDGVTVSESTKIIEEGGNERFSTSVSPEKDAEVRTIVDTVGRPCGDAQVSQDYEDIDVKAEKDDSHLRVTVVDQDGQAVEDARISMVGRGSYVENTDSSGQASFQVNPGYYQIEVSKDRYSTYTDEITLEEGEKDSLRVQIRSRNREAELQVRTEDETGDTVRDVKIIAKNGERQTKYTDFDGETLFSLEPGTYEITASRSGYEIQQRTLELEAGEEHSTTFELKRQRDQAPENAKLRVNVEDDTGNTLEGARVRVVNGDTDTSYTNRYGEVDFSLEPDTYQVRVSKNGYSTERRTVQLDEADDRTLNFRLEDRDYEAANLRVQVRDRDGRSLEDARVKITNGINDQKYTDSRGITSFRLTSGDYRITASKRGYVTRERNVDLRPGQDRSVVLRLRETYDDDPTDPTYPDDDYLNIDQVSYEGTVCRGDDLDIRIRVSNDRDRSERVSIGVRGLGDEEIVRSTIDSDDSVYRVITLEDVEGSGSETIRIAVTNGDTHVRERTVYVRDCGGDDGNDGGSGDDGDSNGPDSVSMQVIPQEIQIGEMIRVSGYVDGVQGRTDVEITSDGRTLAEIATEPDGYYSTYVRPENTGRVEITARAGQRTARQQVNVLPTVEVTSMDAPKQVFETDNFRVCAKVESQITPLVVLQRDGERIDSRNEDGEVCFRTEAQQPGDVEYSIRAAARGVSDKQTRNVEILELGNEVTNFPDKVAMVRSGEGIVRVKLYNTKDDARTYDLNFEGVPRDWFAETQETVTLQSGERESVYFYITPKAEGTFYPELTVEADGREVFEKEIRVNSGGTLQSRKTWKEKILALLRL